MVGDNTSGCKHSQELPHPEALNFILLGNCTFTIKSTNTGAKFTFKIKKARKGEKWWVSMLTGPDNTSHFKYIGFIECKGKKEITLQPSEVKINIKDCTFCIDERNISFNKSKGFQFFEYVITKLMAGVQDIKGLLIWKSTKCARCGRKLTDEDSADIGIGAKCLSLMAIGK